ncbi:uncharacterized protein LOC142176057 [Nicotiana tabacum]|uniref:Uncharacterized protein LOC142176057 n=1 Tax=Nicotiana tabacum TaxID=4097 RepID=A0AC58TPR3_TOBAC
MDFLSLKALQGGSVSFGNGKRGNKMKFLSKICTVTNLVTSEVVLVAKRYKNIYTADCESLQSGDLSFLKAVDNNAELWHRRLGIGKHVKSSFKPKKDVSTSKPLDLLHMDLRGPMRVQSRGGKRYIFVIVDDYSRFTWTLFLKTKDETFEICIAFVKKIPVKMESKVACIRSDHGTEFDNAKFNDFCNENRITHNFSAPRTPQQNGVVERKNRTLKEMARTMLIDSGIAKNFWVEAINTACYLVNRCMIRSLLNKTPYELLNGRKPKMTHLRNFGCKCYVLNNGNDQLGKFDAKSNEEIFLGHSSQSKAYKVYNKRTQCVEESVHVIFDESYLSYEESNKGDQDGEPLLVPGEVIDMANGKADMMSQVKEPSEDNAVSSSSTREEPSTTIITTKIEERVVDAVQSTRQVAERRMPGNQSDLPSSSTNEAQVPNWKHKRSHPLNNIITPLDSGVQTRSKARNSFAFSAFLSQIKPKNIKEALKDADWITAMQDELHQFERNNVWHLELLKRFDMEASKVIDTPITIATQLDMDESGSLVNQTMYRGIIGSLLYLTSNRPDIVFSGAMYADADYAGYLVDMKNTSGMAHFLGSCLIS